MGKELGDFQTPPELAAALIRRLGPIGERWPRLLEPTCGRGNILKAALDSANPPREAIGVELQASYCEEARAAVGGRATIVQADIFGIDLRKLPWSGEGPILVVGNPPWVTNAALGKLGSDNRPARRNVKKLGGLDAKTGSSNFDLGETVWLKLIDDLAGQPATIALLCKASVALGILEHLHRTGVPTSAERIEIDARRWFGASVTACFLVVTIGPSAGSGRVDVYPDLDATEPDRAMGPIRGHYATHLHIATAYEFAIGSCPFIWRQGVKHDAAPVMELAADAPGGPWKNGLGEIVDVEPDRVYPLVKGADLQRPPQRRSARRVVLTQETLGYDTALLRASSPKLWDYLHRHSGRFAARRSSIYRERPAFSIFGVGPYTFAPYKAAVAGVHRPTHFRAIGPESGRPVVLDDTCYHVPCKTAAEAAVVAALANDPISLGLLKALAPVGAKRPVTKRVLQAVDLLAVLRHGDRPALVARGVAALVDDLRESPDDPAATVAAEIDRLDQLLSHEPRPTLEPDGSSPESPTDPMTRPA